MLDVIQTGLNVVSVFAGPGLSVTNVAIGGLGVVGIMENGEAAYTAFSKGDILGGINAVADAAHGAKGVRAGVRTQPEIDYERYALKSLRGDFRNVDSSDVRGGASARQAMDAVRK